MSFCYQAIPLGLVIGKMTEYLNDPPLYYSGTAMKCLLRTKHSAKKEFRWVGKGMDKHSNTFAKVMSAILYTMLILTCLLMTEENIETLARNALWFAAIFCICKAFAKN